MRILRLGTLFALVSMASMLGPVVSRATAEEQKPEAKWVDANDDCVSTCPTDKGWVCPCFVLH